RRAEFAIVVWRSDNAFAKMMLPDAVDHHAGCQWVCGAGNPPGQLQTSAALGYWFLFVASQQPRKAAGNEVAKMVVPAANVNLHVVYPGMRALRHTAFLQ